MTLGNTTPTLRIFDVVTAKQFYVDFLGFSVDWEHRFEENFPLYMQISREDCILHLSEHHGDCTPGSRIIIDTKGIDQLQAELAAQDFEYVKPQVEQTDWGSRVMEVIDPFGNRLTFSEASE